MAVHPKKFARSLPNQELFAKQMDQRFLKLAESRSYGPKQITSNQRSFDHHSGARLSCDVRFAPFATLKRTGYSKEAPEMTLAKDLATAIIPSLLLEHLPKSQIDVFVEILQTTSAVDSSSNYSRVSANVLNSLLLAHCVSAASLALADAGFEMMDSVVGCNVGIFKNNNSKRLFWMVDPADDEPETSCSGGGTLVGTCSIAYMPSVGRVTGVVINGDIGDVGFVMECVQVATDASAQILEVVVKKALLFGSDFIKKV
ncbi:Exosome complex component MTR3 [Physocladia obscura]|uniref:Exosome complex component MTR3 n=1 Tax=Physocladia obscura TaxID=109957 RepID=A0AAD5XC21_9FUNG|nr:Exosome complex component MTR3 [Physocladia obscura]